MEIIIIRGRYTEVDIWVFYIIIVFIELNLDVSLGSDLVSKMGQIGKLVSIT